MSKTWKSFTNHSCKSEIIQFKRPDPTEVRHLHITRGWGGTSHFKMWVTVRKWVASVELRFDISISQSILVLWLKHQTNINYLIIMEYIWWNTGQFNASTLHYLKQAQMHTTNLWKRPTFDTLVNLWYWRHKTWFDSNQGADILISWALWPLFSRMTHGAVNHLNKNIKRTQTLTDARGLGVGRRPPPGIIPATALAGASRDRALDSSGIAPGRERQSPSATTPTPQTSHSNHCWLLSQETLVAKHTNLPHHHPHPYKQSTWLPWCWTLCLVSNL